MPTAGPFGSPHLLLTAHGSMPGGESWSCGLRTVAATPDASVMQLYADYVAKCWQRFWGAALQGPASINPGTVTFAGVTVRALSAAGVTVHQAEGLPTAPTGGANSTQSAPNQCTLAITLHTGLAGRHGKGRIYIPCLSPGVLQLGQMNSGTVQALASQAGELLNDLNTGHSATVTDGTVHVEDNGLGPFPATLWQIAVQSRTSGLPGAPVQLVSVGTVIDTMRSRRKGLKETYEPAPITPPQGNG